MLKRLAYKELEDWYVSNRHSKRKALLVTGARQIGKSYLVEHLAAEKYRCFVEVNLMRDKRAKRSLSQAENLDDFLQRISFLSDDPLVAEDTLIFLDEIQEAPDLMTMAKFVAADGRYDIAYSGSLLGVHMKQIRSFPVGSVHEVPMFPMSFLEFCWAMGVSADALEAVRRACIDRAPLPDYLHEAMMTHFRNYMIVGGMPEAVQTFVDTRGDFAAVRSIQKEINEGYVSDITKYAGSRALNVKAIYEELPIQLDSDTRRFIMASVNPEARYERYRQDFMWLTDAGVALKDNLVREPKSPLKAMERQGYFKLYQSDAGMLVSRYARSVALEIYGDAREANLGAVYENALAQALVSFGYPLNYYMTKKRGEVDFIIEADGGGIVALEAKSGKYPRVHAALDNVLESADYDVRCGVVFSRLNIEQDGKVLYLPWYALAFLRDAVDPEVEFPRAVLPAV